LAYNQSTGMEFCTQGAQVTVRFIELKIC